MAEFRIDRLRFNWKGAWATAVAYRKDDVVQYGGRVYVPLTLQRRRAYTDLTLLQENQPKMGTNE